MEEQDFAMVLHLTLILLFQRETGSIIHIPGKFIPSIILFLSHHIPKREHDKLVECQHIISAKWKSKLRKETECNMSESFDDTIAESSSDVDEMTIHGELIKDLKQLVVKSNE